MSSEITAFAAPASKSALSYGLPDIKSNSNTFQKASSVCNTLQLSISPAGLAANIVSRKKLVMETASGVFISLKQAFAVLYPIGPLLCQFTLDLF